MSAIAMSLSPVEMRYFHIVLYLLLSSYDTICAHHHFKMMLVISQAAKLDMLNSHD